MSDALISVCLARVGLGEWEVSEVCFHYDGDDNRIHEVCEIKSPITLQAKSFTEDNHEISSVSKHPFVLPHPVEINKAKQVFIQYFLSLFTN